MKKYKFEIPETGHQRTYNSLSVCKYQGKRCLDSLIKKGLIFSKPEINFYSVENGIKYYIPIETN